MSLIRLKRQDLHTFICSMILILITSYLFYRISGSVWQSVAAAVLYGACGMSCGIFELHLRRTFDLLVRQLAVSAVMLLAVFLTGSDIRQAAYLFAAYNLTYGCWVMFAKLWMKREISPGWTLLLYDSDENLEKAKAVVEGRRDLMSDAYHCAYGGEAYDEASDCIKKQAASAGNAGIDHIIRLFKIPQMVICLDAGTDEILKYCREAGVTAFVKGPAVPEGMKIDREGLLYIRPVPALWKRALRRLKGGARSK